MKNTVTQNIVSNSPLDSQLRGQVASSSIQSSDDPVVRPTPRFSLVRVVVVVVGAPVPKPGLLRGRPPRSPVAPFLPGSVSVSVSAAAAIVVVVIVALEVRLFGSGRAPLSPASAVDLVGGDVGGGGAPDL